MVLVGERLGIYREEALFAERPSLQRVLASLAMALGLLLALGFALKISSTYSRLWLGSWGVSSALALVLVRWLAAGIVRALTLTGQLVERLVIVGAGPQGQSLAQHLARHGEPRARLLGYVDDRRERLPPRFDGRPMLGDIDHLVRMIRRGEVDDVYIALPWQAHARLVGIVERLALTPVRIHLAPDLVAFALPGARLEQVAGLPALRASAPPIAGWSLVAKRVEDCVVAGLALLALAPLMGAVALAVKLDSPGPVLFRQTRYGFNDEPIDVFKFRTMYVEQASRRACSRSRDDPRVTRVGGFLRRTSLDELPQLLNVLRGDMSLVGPAPARAAPKAEAAVLRRPSTIRRAPPRQAGHHRLGPGQRLARRDRHARQDPQRVEHDLYYIDHWSLGSTS